MEEKLVAYDAADDYDSEECLRSVKADEDRELAISWRKELFQQIKDKLFEYGKLPPLDGTLRQH